MAPYATIDALRADLGRTAPRASDYAAKMLHPIPAADVVGREGLILDLVRGKRVLEFGASGPLQSRIQAAAAAYLGVDRAATPPAIVGCDLDDVTQTALPRLDGCTAIVCGEVLEHLSNPGWFLTRLARQYPGVPVVITVPNAFTEAGRQHALTGVENVNADHVAWYSWRTLRTLLSRHGYALTTFCWYRGQPYTAEGLVALAETTETRHGEG